jgi:hypothetical protein
MIQAKIGLLCLSAFLVFGCAPEKVERDVEVKHEYSKDEFGDAWPYVEIESATIGCRMEKMGSANRPIATMEAEGKAYAFNGAANSFGYPFAETLSELEDIAEKFGVEGNDVLDLYGRQRKVSTAMLDDALEICSYE